MKFSVVLDVEIDEAYVNDAELDQRIVTDTEWWIEDTLEYDYYGNSTGMTVDVRYLDRLEDEQE